MQRLRFPEQRSNLSGANLYLYSDGVTDVRDPEGVTLNVDGITELLQEVTPLAPEPRLRALLRRLRTLRVTDDITLMLISGELDQSAPVLLRYSFPAQPGELAGMRRALASALAHAGVETQLRRSLVLAVDEASTNIIRHGYGGPSDALIHLNLDRDVDTLVFELLDEAPCPDAAALQPRDLSNFRPGGLGLNFIDSLMDDWTLKPRADGCGNRLRMIKRIETEGERS